MEDEREKWVALRKQQQEEFEELQNRQWRNFTNSTMNHKYIKEHKEDIYELQKQMKCSFETAAEEYASLWGEDDLLYKTYRATKAEREKARAEEEERREEEQQREREEKEKERKARGAYVYADEFDYNDVLNGKRRTEYIEKWLKVKKGDVITLIEVGYFGNGYYMETGRELLATVTETWEDKTSLKIEFEKKEKK